MGAQKLRRLAASATAGLFQRIFVINAIYVEGHWAPLKRMPTIISKTWRACLEYFCFLGHVPFAKGVLSMVASITFFFSFF